MRRTTIRKQTPTDLIERFGEWRLNSNFAELHKNDDTVVMFSTGVFKLLKTFISNPNKILSRDDLILLTQGRDAFPYERSIDNMISRLRRKIETDISKSICIKTVWDGCYKFINNDS